MMRSTLDEASPTSPKRKATLNDGRQPGGDPERYSVLRALFPRRPLHWFGVVLALGALAGAGGGAVAVSGLVNLSAVPPHPVGWAHLLHYGMTKSVARHADPPKADEPLNSPAMVMRGASHFALVCENCHGGPGFGQSPIPLSMRPEPPMVNDSSKKYTDAELFFIVQNGVRYTSMPAWPVLNRPDEVWAMVSFLKAMPGMSRETYVRLARGTPDASTKAVESTSVTATAVGEAAARDPQPPVALSPHIPTTRERPYLPGDPQDPDPSPAATVNPRVGFSSVGIGQDPIATCRTCHAADFAGRDGGEYPNLTLQSPQYIYDALVSFATGERQSGIMWPIAGNLSDEDMRSLAARIGTKPAVPSHASGTNANDNGLAARIARGQTIAKSGIKLGGLNSNPEVQDGSDLPPHAVERCTSCHIGAVGLDQVVPRIEGQNAAYLRIQMHAFRAGGRGDTTSYNPMVADSHNLSDSDIQALGDYYASLPPLAKN